MEKIWPSLPATCDTSAADQLLQKCAKLPGAQLLHIVDLNVLRCAVTVMAEALARPRS